MPETAATPAPAAVAPGVLNAFTVDVEDYYQVQAFADVISPEAWSRWPGRVEAATDRFLLMLKTAGVTGTFFVLGCIAARYPALIRRIAEAGHEIASHGWAHVRVWRQSPEEFRADVRRTKGVLEDLSGTRVTGYRAASFSIDGRSFWAYRILREEGHSYSSSIYPIRHDHYGMVNAPRTAFLPGGPDGVVELPMTTVERFGHRWPCSGGGYFRLFPYALSRAAMRRVNRADGMPCIFYTHPWEIDPDQPRPAGLSRKTRFRHYVNLSRTAGRIDRLLRDFGWDRMDRVFAGPIGAAAEGTLPGGTGTATQPPSE
ncbi:MAG: DUF3473 domain-containing protein [Alphaproteobacteria bacterium]|nr:DUF3473 domain-containing protein [Alphaproteobacteria bacterium]